MSPLQVLFALIGAAGTVYGIWERVARQRAERRLRELEQTPRFKLTWGQGFTTIKDEFSLEFTLENLSKRPLYIRPSSRVEFRWCGAVAANKPKSLPVSVPERMDVGQLHTSCRFHADALAPWEELDTWMSGFAVLVIDTSMGSWEFAADELFRDWAPRLKEFREKGGAKAAVNAELQRVFADAAKRLEHVASTVADLSNRIR